jgi:hypothetical protein
MATDAEMFTPEIFRYEAFNGHDGDGLTGALKALQKLVRLNAIAHRGIAAGDSLVGDDALLIELAVAIECAAAHALGIWEKGEIKTEGGDGDDDGDDATT